jgi:hypothetical protein
MLSIQTHRSIVTKDGMSGGGKQVIVFVKETIDYSSPQKVTGRSPYPRYIS